MKIIQISDLHLYESVHTLMDMGSYSAPFSTEKSFQQVRTAIIQQQNNAELIIVSGDIAEQPSQKTYQRIAPLLQQLPAPYYCIAGNHDHSEDMKQYLHTVEYLDHDNWRIIFLDTSKPHCSEGYLSSFALQQLESYLQTQHHVLIAMHHHPIPIHSQWMDNLCLQQPEAFLQILQRYSHIKAVIFGHIHQAFDEIHHNIRYLGTVSTCIQFYPHQDDMLFSSQPPGYREINLQADGSITTTIHFAN